jgi:hypothetical protein
VRVHVCCPSWNRNPVDSSRPFIGNGTFLRKRVGSKTFARPVKALRPTYAPYVPSYVSLGIDHIAQGMNFTPFAVPVVIEASEPYRFSTPVVSAKRSPLYLSE